MIAKSRPPILLATCVLAFAAVLSGLHLLSARFWIGTLWGAHFWAFLPAWALLTAFALTVLAAAPLTMWIAAAVRGTAGTDRDAEDHSVARKPRLSQWAVTTRCSRPSW